MYVQRPPRHIASRLAAAVLLSACLATSLHAQTQTASLQDIGTRFGLTPAQAREAYARMNSNDALIAELSRETGVQRRTLQAVALELGARNPTLSPEAFVKLIRAQTAEAARMRTAIASQERTISSLDPGGERTRAISILKLAQAAFDEGRLEEAESEFAKLSFLRQSELATARNAWLVATDLQAQSAALRGDVETADRILSAKSGEIARQRHAAEREQWLTELKRADLWYKSGDLLGKNEDLLRAIRIFNDSVLPLAPRSSVPIDWAYTQRNLGNALLRLGEREPESARLNAAIVAFRAALEEWTHTSMPRQRAETLTSLGNALNVLAERESAGTAKLEEAVSAYRAAMELAPRSFAPLGWAMAQNNLGNALRTLGERESGTVRLEEAVSAYRGALEVWNRTLQPLDWAMTKNNLGNALQTLGKRESDTARLEEAVGAYRAALEEWTRVRVPLLWANTQNNLGGALTALADRVSNTALLEEAVNAYRAALQETTRSRTPLAWARTQHNLGNVLQVLGKRESGTAHLLEAVSAYRSALEELTRARVPLQWAVTQNSYAQALAVLGNREASTARLEEAVDAFRSALEEFSRARMLREWATTQNNLGGVLFELGDRESNTARLEEASGAYSAALEVFANSGASRNSEIARGNLQLVEKMLREHSTQKPNGGASTPTVRKSKNSSVALPSVP